MSDALPISPRSNLEQYKKLAKDFQQASANPTELDKVATRAANGAKIPPKLLKHEAARIENRWRQFKPAGGTACKLTEAQFFVARQHGFASWPKFASHLRALSIEDSPIAIFETAADAIVKGEQTSLRRLLAKHPQLVHARSTRDHRSTLLHYVSANGIEDFRQKTPKNIVQITGLLLDSGAEVNAESDAYGGHSTTLNLTATSCHPEQAGVQLELLELLLDHGAEVGHKDVLGCLNNGRAQAAEFLAGQGAPLSFEEAAGIGRLDLLQTFKKPTKAQLSKALSLACQFGKTEVAHHLLDQGATAKNALHWAVWGPHLDIVKLLLSKATPLDVKDDQHHATPLEWIAYAQQSEPARRAAYDEVLKLLKASS